MQALVLCNTDGMPREEWLEWRRKGIGSSDAAAICGLSPWRSPWAVWLDKLGQLPDEGENERMYWGRVLEDVVASEFGRRTGYPVEKIHNMLQHPVHPYMICNLDYVTQDADGPAIVECKTSSAFNSEQWVDVPQQYILQAHHQMAVTGHRRTYIPVLIGGNEFLIKTVERDEEIINLLIQREQEFWQMVSTRTPPTPDAQDTQIINHLYEVEEGKIAYLDLEDEAHIEAYLQARSEESAWKKRKDAAANALRVKLGAAEIGIVAGVERVWWRGKKERRFNCK